MSTKSISKAEIERDWHLVDAKDKVLGRIATGVAEKLIGKNKPYYTPNLDCGDYVVVINAKDIQLTRRKAEKKVYRHHTGYPGGFRETPFKKVMEKNPAKIIEKAVVGMLPKNKLRSERLRRLKVYSGGEHPYKKKFSESK